MKLILRTLWATAAAGLLLVGGCAADSAAPASAASSAVPAPIVTAPPSSTTATSTPTTSTPTTDSDLEAEPPLTGGATPSPAQSTGPAAGTTLTVPVTTSWQDPNQPIVVVDISVGGGGVVPVQLDTGSTGLIIDASVVGPQVTLKPTDTFTETFVGAQATGTVATSTITINGSTTAAVDIGLIDLTADPSFHFNGPARGLMGIGAANDGSIDNSRYAPQFLLPAPLNSGSSFDIAQSGSGTWTLGPVSPPASAISVPLQPITTNIPAGYPVTPYQKDVNLCWTLGADAQKCANTDLDLGAPHTLLNAATYSALSTQDKNGDVAAGLPITIATPDARPLWSLVTGTTIGQDAATVDELGSYTEFNTGMAFFFSHFVGFDYANGKLWIADKT